MLVALLGALALALGLDALLVGLGLLALGDGGLLLGLGLAGLGTRAADLGLLAVVVRLDAPVLVLRDLALAAGHDGQDGRDDDDDGDDDQNGFHGSSSPRGRAPALIRGLTQAGDRNPIGPRKAFQRRFGPWDAG